MDQDAARAYCEAGYMPLREYLQLFEANGWKTAETIAVHGPEPSTHSSPLEKAIAQLKVLGSAMGWPQKMRSGQTYRDVA